MCEWEYICSRKSILGSSRQLSRQQALIWATWILLQLIDEGIQPKLLKYSRKKSHTASGHVQVADVKTRFCI